MVLLPDDEAGAIGHTPEDGRVAVAHEAQLGFLGHGRRDQDGGNRGETRQGDRDKGTAPARPTQSQDRHYSSGAA
jgi:hypothetical protein